MIDHLIVAAVRAAYVAFTVAGSWALYTLINLALNTTIHRRDKP